MCIYILQYQVQSTDLDFCISHYTIDFSSLGDSSIFLKCLYTLSIFYILQICKVKNLPLLLFFYLSYRYIYT